MKDNPVLIAGGGPTGMMLAAELALAGVAAVIVERRAGQEMEGSRALGLQARTLEVFDQRGILERFLAEGQPAQVQGFAGVRLDISDFPSRHPYGLAIGQPVIERILAGWVEELGVEVLRRREVTGFSQDDSGVSVFLADGESLRASYLVGCDGGRSAIRKAAGIDFLGLDATTSWINAEVEMAEEPELGLRPEGGGIGPGEQGRYRMVLVEEGVPRGEPGLEDVRAALIRSLGRDFGLHSPAWISRFTDMTRQAADYRAGRVLLAGDACHVHPPQGGQGLSLGVQDAVNLGWKLAQVVKGESSDSLLLTYQVERHPVAARVLRNSRATMAVGRPDGQTEALRELVGELLGLEQARKWMAGILSGLDIRYDLGEGHPLLGRRMPDLDLVSSEGRPVRVFELLREGRPLLLDLGAGGPFPVDGWPRLRLVSASYGGPWKLPVVGEVSAPAAVLVRPDGYVGWVAPAVAR